MAAMVVDIIAKLADKAQCEDALVELKGTYYPVFLCSVGRDSVFLVDCGRNRNAFCRSRSCCVPLPCPEV